MKPSARHRAMDCLREACLRRGLTLEVVSSHPTAKRAMRNGPLEWLDITVTDPKSDKQSHCSTTDGGKVVEFLAATLRDVQSIWPRPRGGWPVRRERDAEMKRKDLARYRKANRTSQVAREQAIARGEVRP